MKKLSLKIDDLRIETFSTDAPAARGGTVHAEMVITRVYEATCIPWECYAYTEQGWGTAYNGGPCVRCA
ncbi:hypothetical protein [Longimicrobium terrae]|uniref:Uncharacterized protein n=1 Tax=Longimicrobium terrae TaxID=1639882 RepID=A0A841GZL5_9BACT|nr:hypothetical protein [Longimicrobium terrae]MBB4636882.1 hypothetical protein [Longimicrobium terrae]MBB6071119.1 hypothetical protein [Longimicrobium terrae]NNC29168.1 hypothetical protein [Longimicrobium terrae]